MNYCKIEVDKIRSYQTLIIKTGRFTYPSKHYKPYKAQLHIGMKNLTKVKGEVPILCHLRFNVKGGVDEEKWVVKLQSTGNTSKLLGTQEEAIAYHDPKKHYIEHRPLVIRYGSVADNDNAQKAVIDYLEEMKIIENDRQIVDTHVTKTFNNSSESIEVTLEKLEINDNGIISFTKNK